MTALQIESGEIDGVGVWVVTHPLPMPKEAVTEALSRLPVRCNLQSV